MKKKTPLWTYFATTLLVIIFVASAIQRPKNASAQPTPDRAAFAIMAQSVAMAAVLALFLAAPVVAVSRLRGRPLVYQKQMDPPVLKPVSWLVELLTWYLLLVPVGTGLVLTARGWFVTSGMLMAGYLALWGGLWLRARRRSAAVPIEPASADSK